MGDQVMPDKPRGRPRNADPTVTLSLRVSTKQYDQTYASARAERLTIGDWIRRVLRDAASGRPPGDHS